MRCREFVKAPGAASASAATRRRFVAGAVAATVGRSVAQSTGRVRGFDHVALPMQNTDAMIAFYQGLGFDVVKNNVACSVYIGDQMINFHLPATWQRESFTLRAPAAKPPCGDLCFVWEGTPEALKAMLEHANARIIEGPVARQGGRRKASSSVYVRDPDGNLLEFMIY
jgi:catechol 2,3-dioxygenase-like lactoylglutathione lyase family enzyme